MTLENFDFKNNLAIQLHGKKKIKFNKPQASYITLIQEAIEKSSNQGLTLNEIYESLKKDYECFRTMEYEGWKNSIRHNLSLNDCFIKVPKVKGKIGKGHFWRINPNSKNQFNENTIRRRPRGYRSIQSKQNSSLNSSLIKSFGHNENFNHTNEQPTIIYQSNCPTYFNVNQQTQQVSLKASHNLTYTNSTSLNYQPFYHPSSASNETQSNFFQVNPTFNQIEAQKTADQTNHEQFVQISSPFNTRDIASLNSYENLLNQPQIQYNHFDPVYSVASNAASNALSNSPNNDTYQINTPSSQLPNYLCNSSVPPSIENPNLINMGNTNVSSGYNDDHLNDAITLSSFSQPSDHKDSDYDKPAY